MDKAYARINWQNSPSTATALGATNLNKIDVALNEVDNRVVAMDTSKADLSTVNAMVKNVTFESSTGVITITYQNGTTSTIDTAMEKIVTNFSYNAITQCIDLVLADGSMQSIDISDFVTNVDFTKSDTIQFSVDSEGKTKAEVINGSITDEKMQPNYLADITVQAQTATEQAQLAKRYAVGGVTEGDKTDNAQYYAQQAEFYAGQANKTDYNNLINKPTSLPANGGNADTVGGKHATDFLVRGDLNNVSNFDTHIICGVYRVNEITDTNVHKEMTQYGQLLVLNGDRDTVTQIYSNFDTNKIFHRSCHSWGSPASTWTAWEKINDGGNADTVDGKHASDFVQTTKIANNLTTNQEGYVLDARQGKVLNDNIISSANNITKTRVITTANTDLLAFIDGLSDTDFPINSTICIRAFNCSNSPLDGKPIAGNVGDFFIFASAIETKAYIKLFAMEMTVNRLFTNTKDNGVWKQWTQANGFVYLPDNTDILNYVSINSFDGDRSSFRCLGAVNAPRTNSDFFFDVWRLGVDWIKVKAYEMGTNTEYLNSKINGAWSGWVQTTTQKI